MKILVVLFAMLACVVTFHLPLGEIRQINPASRKIIEKLHENHLPLHNMEIPDGQSLPAEAQPTVAWTCMLPAPCKILHWVSRSYKAKTDDYINFLLPYVPKWTVEGVSSCAFEIPCDKVPDYAQRYVYFEKQYLEQLSN